MEDNQEHGLEVLLELLDLPSDLLIKCLVSAGYKAICAAATSCKRLREETKVFKKLRVFASALSTKPDFEEAIADACTRALQGTLGHITFALVFVSGYKRPKINNTVQLLEQQLPADTAIIGCEGGGLMGVGSDGTAAEVDPGAKGDAGRGVVVLLGHLPDVEVRLMATGKVKQEEAVAELRSCLGPSDQPLHVHSAMLLVRSSAQKLLYPQSPALRSLQQQLFPGHTAVVGGAAAGSETLFIKPCRQQVQAGSLSRPRIVGLALCSSEAAAAQAPAGSEAGQAAAGGSSRAVRAAALSIHGTCPVPCSVVWHSLELTRAWGTTQTGEEVVLLESATCSKPEQQQSLMEALLAAPGNIRLALWASPADQPSMEFSHVVEQGLPVVMADVMDFVEEGGAGEGVGKLAALLCIDHDEAADLDGMMAAAERSRQHKLCCQMVEMSGPAALAVMRAELPLLRRMCEAQQEQGSRALLGQEWYQVLRRSAASVGARSGAQALAVFSCTGRGQALHGCASAEAVALDDALGRQVPFAGVYCNGELGPIMKAGYCGWSASSAVAGGQHGGGAAGCAWQQAGRRAAPCFMPSVLQGFTTMFGMIA